MNEEVPDADHMAGILSRRDQAAIAQAALLAHQGRHAEAECARFSASYHNLKEVIHPEA